MYRPLLSMVAVTICGPSVWAADATPIPDVRLRPVIAVRAGPRDTPATLATRLKLQTRISVDYQGIRLADLVRDLSQKVKEATDQDLRIRLDNAGGVSSNRTLLKRYVAAGKTVAEVLDDVCRQMEIGYIVINGTYRRYRADGCVLILHSSARGFLPGEPPRTVFILAPE
jgi:hypothetical protein